MDDVDADMVARARRKAAGVVRMLFRFGRIPAERYELRKPAEPA